MIQMTECPALLVLGCLLILVPVQSPTAERTLPYTDISIQMSQIYLNIYIKPPQYHIVPLRPCGSTWTEGSSRQNVARVHTLSSL